MVQSKKPGKQRKSAANAPIHLKRKRVRARLQSDDPRLASVRTVTVRTGDEVKIVRGDGAHGGKRHGGKRKSVAQSKNSRRVIRVDSNTNRLFLEGLTITTSDNKEEAIPVNASNVIVTKLDETDPRRLTRLTEDRS
ncbi:MAG: 50S ribosomal protein L24 [Euryarchaeota archaeon]|mgnify:CR=1 FL=1|jgi:large subunit ribosomal protein L24|nr:50S ribosomal protein L24 [Euryarchaeota archaeon]MBT4407387.1 50S ribosomal protein L24 [Euryarchaeota archaeon]